MHLKKIKKALQNVESYEAWKESAKQHDAISGMEAWKKVNHSNLYDNDEIALRLTTLRTFRDKGDDEGLLFTLNEGIHGNMGGMGNPKLHQKALFGTKQLITDYVDEVADALAHLADINNDIPFEDKLDFFRRASHCFGRSALMLSGGGQLGNFHGGVLKALVEQDLLPDIISGSSAGSIFAALAGTHRNETLLDFLEEDNQLLEEIEKEASVFKNIVNKKTAVGVKDLEALISKIIPDLTFQEAFEKTGRKINISVAPRGLQQKSRLLNAIASPNVLIRSALMASCAVPGIFPPVTLYAKNKDGKVQAYLPSRKWVDGSMSNDLPSKRLARLYGVNHFIVSLTNPIVLPFVNSALHRNEFFAPLVRFGSAIIKESSQFNYSMAKPFFKYAPSLALMANTINSVVQQEYTGDINIVADFSIIKPRKILSVLSREELTELIQKGEQATWPQMEAIRITTKIGRVLDDILEAYELEERKMARQVVK